MRFHRTDGSSPFSREATPSADPTPRDEASPGGRPALGVASRLTVAFAIVMVPSFAFAQPAVEHLTPPVVERGKTTRVTFHGKDLANAEAVWFAVPGLKAKSVESSPTKAVFDVLAETTAPVGVGGLRVATRDGLGNAALFLVDDLPVRARPDGDSPVSLAPPAAAWGTFGDSAVDRYRIEAKAGERLAFEVVSNRLGKDADPLVTIRDAAGKFVAEKDNDPGLYFDCRFAHTFEKAGAYTVEVRDARFRASEANHYVLRVGRFPAERTANPVAVAKAGDSGVSPLSYREFKGKDDIASAWAPVVTGRGPVTMCAEPDAALADAYAQATSPAVNFAYNLTPQRVSPFLALNAHIAHGPMRATPATIPGTLCGVLNRPGSRNAFLLRLEKGQKISVRAQANDLNSPADLEVLLTDRTGRELRRTGETKDEVNFDFAAGNAGEYGLIVRDALRDGGPAFAYRVEVRNDPFPPRLSADVEGLTVPQGSYQTVPIAVTRTGTAGPIRLKLQGAPAGVKLTPDVIGEKENAVVCKLEADASALLGLQTVQIVAESDSASGVERTLVATRPLIDKKYWNVDLIPISLREDQTRLPPALTDRFALMVAPPSPFTFELPESLVTLPRYQTAPIPAVTTRVAGFDGPISFAVKGGQLGDKTEGRTRVYAEFPDATAKTPNVTGTAVSKILSNTAKARIDVTATGTHAGRRVSLTRTFDLDLTPAFALKCEPAKLSLLPGESGTVRLSVTRVKTFDGPVKLEIQPSPGFAIPEHVTIPKGADGIDVPVSLAADLTPRQHRPSFHATALVSGYEEDVRGQLAEIDVKKAEPPKK